MISKKEKYKKFTLKRTAQIINKSELLNSLKSTEVEVESNDDIILKDLITSISKEIRSDGDVKIISEYLNRLKDFYQLIKDSHSENYKDVIHRISSVLKYENLGKDELLFRHGDRGDKFYIILKGSVSILIPKLIETKLSESEYLSYLTNLKMYDENDLLIKVIQLNKKIFRTDEELIDRFLKKQGTVNKGVIRKNSSTLRISTDLAETIKSMLKPDLYKSNKPFSISTTNYIQRFKPTLISNIEEERQNVIVYEYNKILTLKTGDKFGEIALSSNNKKRVATVICEEDCHFGTIDKKSYESCLKELNEKEKKNNMNFLLSNSIFSDCNKSEFMNNYYNLFVKTKVSIHDKLITEDTLPKSIFFIKSGEFQITLNKSIIEIDEYLKSFGIEIKKEEYYQDLMKNSPNFYRFMKEKKLNKICIIQDTEILGLDNMIYDNKYLFNVECVSSTGQFFSLDMRFFKSMLAKDRNMRINKENYELMKRNHLIKRIIQFRKSKLDMYFRFYDDNLFKNYAKMDRECNTSLGKDSDIEKRNRFPIFTNPIIKGISYKEEVIKKLKEKIKSKQSHNNNNKTININNNNNRNCPPILSSTIDNNLGNSAKNFLKNNPLKIKLNSRMKKNSLDKNIHISFQTAMEYSVEKLDKYASNYSQTPFKTNITSENDDFFPKPNLFNNNHQNTKRDLLRMNFSHSVGKSQLNNYNNLIQKQKETIDEMYSSYYLSNNFKSSKVNYIDPLASDDFQRMFKTIYYFKYLSDKKTNHSPLKKKENILNSRKKVGLPIRFFKLSKKNKTNFDIRNYTINQKDLSIQSCKL